MDLRTRTYSEPDSPSTAPSTADADVQDERTHLALHEAGFWRLRAEVSDLDGGADLVPCWRGIPLYSSPS